MKRDLHADLAICESAASGFIFHTGTYSGPHGLYTETTVTTDSCDNISEVDMEFLLEARQGWPEAIRRAIAAEERVKELCESNAYYIDQADRHKDNVYWTTQENERLRKEKRSLLTIADERQARASEYYTEKEQLREQRDYWRAEAKAANLLNAELNGECVGHMEENELMRAQLYRIVNTTMSQYATQESMIRVIKQIAMEALGE